MKDRYGVFAYAVNMAQRGPGKDVAYRAEVDGEWSEFHASSVYVVNSGMMGTGLQITHSYAVDDGLLDAFAIDGHTHDTMIAAASRFLDLHTASASRYHRQCRRFGSRRRRTSPSGPTASTSAGRRSASRSLPGPCPLSSPDKAPRLGLLHRGFDRLYPAIRFNYERLQGHEWFSQVTPDLWVGGAPTYGRDFELLLALGITAVVDLRAERIADPAFFEAHGIAHRQYRVPDVTVPGPEVLTDAVAWIDEQLADGRTVLVHCAKGRGRSATVLAAYLMRERGMTFDEANDLLQSKRALIKLEARHRRVLESWIASGAARPEP